MVKYHSKSTKALKNLQKPMKNLWKAIGELVWRQASTQARQSIEKIAKNDEYEMTWSQTLTQVRQGIEKLTKKRSNPSPESTKKSSKSNKNQTMNQKICKKMMKI